MSAKSRPSVAGDNGSPQMEVREIEFKNAYIIEAQLGDALINAFGEIPMRLAPVFQPLVQAFRMSPRGDVKVREEVPVLNSPKPHKEKEK